MTPRRLYVVACLVAGVVGGILFGLGAPHALALPLGVAAGAALALGVSAAAALLSGRER